MLLGQVDCTCMTSAKCASVMEVLYITDHFKEWSYLVRYTYRYSGVSLLLCVSDLCVQNSSETVQELVPHTSVCDRITLWPDLDLALHRTLSLGGTECELEEKKETTWKQSNFFSE